ncbi:MAG: hypothetical protein AB7P40_19435 [Chloroflexota bacterium]
MTRVMDLHDDRRSHVPTGRHTTPTSRAAALSRRRFLAAVGLGLTVAALGSSPALAQDGPAGRLVLPRGREIVLMTPDGQDDRTIQTLEMGEFVADVALSPDGRQVAFGLFTARAGSGPGGSDIVIAATEAGGQRTMIVPRDRPGTLLAAPYWSPDGASLVFEAVGLDASGKPTISTEWVASDGSGRRTVAMRGRYPSISPDGRRVVYVVARPTGDALYEQPISGGEPREIVPEGEFLVITYPRYSPDGALIAFAGVADGLPGLLPQGAPTNPVPPGTTPKLLSEHVVPARDVAGHGFPADPWIVPTAGGEPMQLAPLPVDDAAIAWSPDGGTVAVSGAAGVHLVALADGSARRISDNGSFGAIDWR